MTEIKGLEVFACHGVLASEKVSPQPFVFDIRWDSEIYPSALSDDIGDTINYAEVCAFVYDFCKNNSFNLLERLAYAAAFSLAEKFTAMQNVTVTVHKPNAPIPQKFADVSVSATVERNKVILSLGSSIGDGENFLNNAIASLKAVRGIKLLKTSPYIKSVPYGGVAKNAFTNCAVSLECLLSPRALLEAAHKIEAEYGRVRAERWGDRTLDIDIIFFGDKIICEEGLCVPHPDYMCRAFVVDPIKEIEPDFVCPLTHKRIADIQF